MKIGIVSDHRGYKTKTRLVEYLEDKGYDVTDYGTNSNQPVDYPLFAFKLGEALANGDVENGIAICGTGIGIGIALNKVKKVICAKVSNKKEATLAKEHNHANSISFAASIPFFKIKGIVNSFLTSKPLKYERHVRRVKQILDYEEK